MELSKYDSFRDTTNSPDPEGRTLCLIPVSPPADMFLSPPHPMFTIGRAAGGLARLHHEENGGLLFFSFAILPKEVAYF